MILSSTLAELRKKVRRFSLRYAERAPDAAALGTVLERNGTGRFWQALVQDPDPAAVAALQSMSGVSDFEDVPVTLEEVYAALYGPLRQWHGHKRDSVGQVGGPTGVVTRLASGRKK